MTLVIFPFGGWINGYKSAELYSYFKGTNWKSLTITSAVFYPIVFSTLYNLVLVFEPEQMTKLLGEEVSAYTFAYLWLFINLPTTALGSFLGFKTYTKVKSPRINRMSR